MNHQIICHGWQLKEEKYKTNDKNIKHCIVQMKDALVRILAFCDRDFYENKTCGLDNKKRNESMCAVTYFASKMNVFRFGRINIG